MIFSQNSENNLPSFESVRSLDENALKKVNKAKSFAFKPFNLMTEKRSKEIKTQSFYYTPVVSNLEKRKFEKNGSNSNLLKIC